MTSARLIFTYKGEGIPITDHEGPKRDVDARVLIFAATTLGRDREASSTLFPLYRRESPVLILEEAE